MTFTPDTGRHAALVGATASGKSRIALEVARRCDGVEIVSVDSMQVYRGMDVGTAKPTREERREIRHHVIDVVDPDEDYTLSRFQRDVAVAVEDVESRGGRALLVGGTGLYLRAAVDDLDIPGRYPATRAEIETEPDTDVLFERLVDVDPVAAERMEPTNRRRIVRALEVAVGSGRRFSSYGPGLSTYQPTPFVLLGLRRDRGEIDARIESRFDDQLRAGFLDEVRGLADRARGISPTARQALGYRELLAHVEDGVPLEEATSTAVARTRRFARRQDRWFRRDPRIRWYDVSGNEMATPGRLLGDWLACT